MKPRTVPSQPYVHLLPALLGCMEVPGELAAMLAGEHGPTRQKAARLVADLALAAGASQFTKASNAHVSGVSVITGGVGLRRFLADLASDGDAKVAIPTTLNSAGCDSSKLDQMGIDYPEFMTLQAEIVTSYWEMGIQTTLSCTPYDHDSELSSGIGSWAESNAVCFANTYTDLATNRESGLSALGTALTGWAPLWGLHLPSNRKPNILVKVECDLTDSTDFSVLGDWIGRQIEPDWTLPFGPMPRIRGLPGSATFEMKKALTAAAANFGCPMLWADGLTRDAPDSEYQGSVTFTQEDLDSCYRRLAPAGRVDLVVIGCPQASLGEARAVAAEVRARMELGEKIPDHRLWLFTSRTVHDQLLADGTSDILEEGGVLLLKDTCPEVTPYNRDRYNYLLTNSMKAEHYLTSGLNSMPTSVARIRDCVAHAFDPDLSSGPPPSLEKSHTKEMTSAKTWKSGEISLKGSGLPSQHSFEVTARALVTDIPITYLGYVDPETGIVTEPGHPLQGHAIGGKILVYPRGSGSTVAPYVLMGLSYGGKAPAAILNRDVCPLTLPAASIQAIPYGHDFDGDPTIEINSGDLVKMTLNEGIVTVTILNRAPSPDKVELV